MWFLIKGTFWFSLVLVLLPFLDTAASSKLERGPSVELGDTFAAASEALTYVRAICEEKPDVCEKGAETFVALGHRAREGAKVAYKLLDTQFADPDLAAGVGQPLPEPAGGETVAKAEAADTVITGTIAIPTRRPDRTE
ncbi:DUF5330 domain-containing protein [Rhizobium sp. TRM95111]|uniref:DUF5330 domain-containing protein n=1 Tax=Rhizobium alarense TaxID=2846851 RepID=UPI001F397895|nr:DUF5330 domain-containing protein [Rhizobium alarense]MCF3638618.1 DUF5330 domain-containing protein [Rhizobium alarense]